MIPLIHSILLIIIKNLFTSLTEIPQFLRLRYAVTTSGRPTKVSVRSNPTRHFLNRWWQITLKPISRTRWWSTNRFALYTTIKLKNQKQTSNAGDWEHVYFCDELLCKLCNTTSSRAGGYTAQRSEMASSTRIWIFKRLNWTIRLWRHHCTCCKQNCQITTFHSNVYCIYCVFNRCIK